jgi:transposase InsO family protein
MCERIARGRPVAHVAKEMGISRATASKWWHRYRQDGVEGLVDRRSAPGSTPTRLPARTERRIIGLRVNRRWGPARIGGHLGLNPPTVWRVLVRYRISRLRDLDPPSGRVIRRYEKKIPGELVHVDIKKLGRIPDGGGWRAHGRQGHDHSHRMGYTYLHSVVDDHTRIAYSCFYPDETGNSCIRFLQEARDWFAQRGIMIQAVMTDNGVGYTSRVFADTLESVGITHIRIQPYRPQTNGKVERYQRTLTTEWAYTRIWTSNQEREDALHDWLHQYNHHRYHTAIHGPPISRVNNLRDQYN